jgi:hypothetical protein
VAMQTIKSIAARPWNGRARTHAPWYEPLDEQSAIDAAVGWVLSRPDVFLNAVSDIQLLPKVLDATARTVEGPMSQDAYAQELSRLQLETLFV